MKLSEEVLKAYRPHRRCADKNGTLCHAPARGMMFSMGGRVVACCVNTATVLGKYPQQSIMETWRSAAMRDFQNAFTHVTLHDSCGHCAALIGAGNYSAATAYHYDDYAPTVAELIETPIRKALGISKPAFPRHMEFELTNTCNLECVMCSGLYSSSIRHKREGLPPLPDVYDAAWVEQLKEFIPHLKRATFKGGEPFLISIYYDVWEEMIRLNPRIGINITTNGTVFSPKVKRVLEKLPFFLNISIDGITKETFEKIRVNADFEKTMQNVRDMKAISDRRNCSIGLSVTPSVLNVHEVPQLAQWANEMNFYLTLNVLHTPEHLSLRSLSRAQLEEIIARVSALQMPAGTALQRNNRQRYNDWVQQLNQWKEEAETQPRHTPVPLSQRTSEDSATSLVIRTILEVEQHAEGATFSFLDEAAAAYPSLHAFVEAYMQAACSFYISNMDVSEKQQQNLKQNASSFVEQLQQQQAGMALFKQIIANNPIRVLGYLADAEQKDIGEKMRGLTAIA